MTTKSIIKGIVAVGLAALAGACSSDAPFGGEKGNGTISPRVGLSTNVRAPRQSDDAPGSRAGEITREDLSLKLIAEDGSVKGQWEKLADFDPAKPFAVGNYTMEAWNGTAGAQGFECPYYYGSAQLRVQDSKTTEVALTASLAQAMVTVKYTDVFQNYMTDWSATVNSIAYAQNETRPAYVTPGTVTVNVSFTKPNGKKGENVRVASFDALARTHYTVTVNVNDGHAGDAELVITYDDEMAQQEVTLDISDDVLNAAAPEVATEGFTSGEAVSVVEGMDFDGSLKVNFIAMANLRQVTMQTSSRSLAAQGWPESIDLIGATAEQQAKLRELGFDALGLWRNVGQMAVLDFSKVPAHLTVSEIDNVSTFTLTAVDSYGKTTEPVELALSLEPLVLELAANTYEPGQKPSFTLTYNGLDVANKVKYQYVNERGTWSEITNFTVTPAGRAVSTYTVTVNQLPENVKQLKVKAVCGAKETPAIVIAEFPFELTANSNDVFARHALLGVSGSDVNLSELAAGMKVMAKNGNDTKEIAYTVTSDGIRLTGLEPGKKITLYATLYGLRSENLEIETEADAQIPYSDMEQWGEADGHSNWSRWFLGSQDGPWGTMNWYTTSYTGTRDYTAYCNFSGTRSTTDAHTGSTAAIIETVGWGGNAAQAWWTNSEHITPGQLYLGSANGENPNYGTAFESRPGKVTFWYKYSARNSADYGKAIAKVLDAQGNVLAQDETNLTASDSYRQISFDFESKYALHCNKAASIQLTFLSSGHPDVQNQNNDKWLTRPPFANLSDGRFTGSSLYIDDVELIY